MFSCRHCEKRCASWSTLAKHSADCHPRERNHAVHCPVCGQRAALCVRGEPRWLCVLCGTSVGCAKGSFFPSGIMATPALHAARFRVHQAMRRLGRYGVGRRHLYALLAQGMGIPSGECQVSLFDHDRCELALRVCAEIMQSRGRDDPTLAVA